MAVDFRVETDGDEVVLRAVLCSADDVEGAIEDGDANDVPADWKPSDAAMERILDGIAEDMESSGVLSDAFDSEVTASIRFAASLVYGDGREGA